MRLLKIAPFFEVGHNVSYRGGADVQVEPFYERARSGGFGGRDEEMHDGLQDQFFAFVEALLGHGIRPGFSTRLDGVLTVVPSLPYAQYHVKFGIGGDSDL